MEQDKKKRKENVSMTSSKAAEKKKTENIFKEMAKAKEWEK